ncbi:hypothetical protein KP509_23G052100 [Ceratopteris richardii]|uniref:Uncharacterized protein n=1 Tax=Ceratopteris richardii TaxID=49495 RepID=A0A8T2S0D9_CERRI|nr:hypothetical protein KP509_23G052100 [Ceratopteris richardii]
MQPQSENEVAPSSLPRSHRGVRGRKICRGEGEPCLLCDFQHHVPLVCVTESTTFHQCVCQAEVLPWPTMKKMKNNRCRERNMCATTVETEQ